MNSPPSRTFDHAIELNKGFSPKVAKVYPLNPKEQAYRVFVDEHLKSRKIIPSKSPQALPFFFVSKKGWICKAMSGLPVSELPYC